MPGSSATNQRTGTARDGMPPPLSGSGANRVHNTAPCGSGSPAAMPRVNGSRPSRGRGPAVASPGIAASAIAAPDRASEAHGCGGHHLPRRADLHGRQAAGRVGGVGAVGVDRRQVALVGEVGQVQRHGQVLRWAQRAEVIGHRGIDQPVARHRHIVGVGHVALADMVGRQAHVPRARGPCQGAGEHPLRGVDGLLAARRHHAVDHGVVVVGAVIPRQRVGPGQVLHRLQLQVRLGAAAGHRTDVGEQRRAAEDAHALGDRQQAVVELHVVGGDGRLVLLAEGTEAGFQAPGLFRLQPGAGRERFRRDLQRAAAATADEGGDVLGVRSEQLVVGVELEAQADLRQHRFLRGQRARGDAGLHARVGGGAHAGVRALDADVHGQALVQEAHAVLHVELAGDGGVALVPHAL
ncbi:hypothetical protein G6F31_013762 [Rhizopus arrhizus]|nr:hypothetical protein G6F31_013762 [Rhizopus arrhizus]